MSTQVSKVSAPTPKIAASDHLSRPMASYHPTIWGDHFLSHVFDSENVDTLELQQYEGLQKEMRNILVDVMDEPFNNLRLIDAVQCLAVDYHFRNEIEISMKKLYDFNSDEKDLNSTSLRFRLLRQHGFHTSCDVFEKFKDNEGNFKENLINDVEGMLNLYEATHLGIQGEEILDEAMTFTTQNLQSILLTDKVKPYLREQIKHALDRPIRKYLPRVHARYFLDVYSNDDSHNPTLLKFAKLDFNILQRLHQKELHEITKWWKNLNTVTRFPYVRDRIVECYFWIMGVYFEPHFSLARKILTKVIAMATIIDDTYDNYATVKELEIFTEAMRRWNIEEMNKLPDYMKILYQMLIDNYNEFEEELAKEGRSFCVHYAKEALKKATEAYLHEAQWRSKGYVPTMEEHMRVSLISTCYPMLITASFLGMGKIATHEIFKWVSSIPKIVHASCIVCRLMDDVVSHEFEQKREHVASAIECYMKQYSVGEEEVIQLFQKEIANAWKDINEECLKEKQIPKSILERVLNFARVMDLVYKEDDGFTNSHVLKHHIASLLNDPVDFPLQ